MTKQEEYMEKRRKRDRDYFRRRKAEDPNWSANRRLRKRFGITIEQYLEMEAQQRGRCAICRTKRVTKRFCVDHDHETGQVRGLLCSRCNTLLGLARDNPKILISAARYLL